MTNYDVIVIGGGAAGLSAALLLSRARRRVVVVDAGAPRNAPAGHVHGFLSRDGITPSDLLAAGRQEVARYGGAFHNGTAIDAVRAPGGFRVQLNDGTEFTSRRLLVATGLHDELPDIPGLRERWGRDVLHCPYCHGFEVRDDAVGVLGGAPMSIHQAHLIRQIASDIVYFTHTGELSQLEREQFDARGISIVDQVVTGLVVDDGRLAGVRVKALGVWGALGAAAGTTGLLAGGVLTRYAGWPCIFCFNVPIGVMVLLLARRMVLESRSEMSPRRYDPFGALTITAALICLVYAISQAPQVGWAGPQTVGMLAGAGALLVAFILIETRVESPLLPLRLLRVTSIAGSNAVSFLLGTSFLTFVFLGTLYMQQVLGYSALQTGAAWCVASVTSVSLAGLSQKLVTRTSPQLVMALGLSLIGAGLLWATRAPADGHFWPDLAGPFFVSGAGTAFSFIPISIGALSGITERDAGVASGLLNTTQQIGAAIGVAIASTIAATRTHAVLAEHGTAMPVALTDGFHWAFLVCGLTALLAPIVALATRRRAQAAPAPVSSEELVEQPVG